MGNTKKKLELLVSKYSHKKEIHSNYFDSERPK
jgi:hypothetical protein